MPLRARSCHSDEAAQQARTAAGDQPCADPLPTSCRFAGAGREETAALVAAVVAAEHPGALALVARSDDFADALTGGAFGARSGTPILLTPTDLAHPATVAFLEAHGLHTVIALGGAAAISDATLAALPAEQRGRVAGAERTATSAALVDSLWAPNGMGAGGVVLVNVRSAQGWQSALAAAVASAIFDAPQLGVEDPPADLSPAAADVLTRLNAPIQAFGDPSLVSDRQIADASAA